MYKVEQKTYSYIKAISEDGKKAVHMVRKFNTDYSVTNWLVWEETIGADHFNTSEVNIKPDYKIIGLYGIDPNTYYAIFDRDTRDYIHTGRNAKRPEDAFESYIHLRADNIEELFKRSERVTPKFHEKYKGLKPEDLDYNKLSEWAEEVKYFPKFIAQDMAAMNYTLEELDTKLPEEEE